MRQTTTDKINLREAWLFRVLVGRSLPEVILGLWLPALLLLLGFGLRLHRLGDQSTWWDEGWSVWLARQPLVEIGRITSHDVHPPLYYWLLHAWRQGSGDSEIGLRYLSAMAGVMTVAATYRLGHTAGGRTTGLLAALFLAFSRFSVAWSQEIRMYPLAALLAALGLWAAIRAWDRGRPVDWLLYIGCMVAGLYTLYLFGLVLIVANVAWLWVWRASANRRRALARWVAAQVAIVVLFSPWALYAASRFLTRSEATPLAPADFLKIYWTTLTVGIPLNVDIYAWLTLPVLAIFAAGVALLARQARVRGDWRQGRNVTLFLTGLLLPAAIVYLVAIPKTGFQALPLAPRYLLISAAFYSILLAWGVARLGVGQRWPLALAGTAVILYAAWWGLRSYHPGRVLIDDYKSLAATIEAHRQPDDAVVLLTDTDWPIFAYHHPGHWWGVPHTWTITAESANNYLVPIWQAHEGVWLVVTPYAAASDPQGEMPGWLADQARTVVAYPYGDKLLRFYARTEARAAAAYELAAGAGPHHRLAADLGHGAWLAGYDQFAHDYKSGDVIHLFLYWRSGDRPVGAEVGLIDAGGRAWQWQWQRLGRPDAERIATPGLVRQQIDFTVSPEAPSGAYAFYVLNDDGQTTRFGQVWLRQKQDAFLTAADVAIAHRLDTHFGAGIRLLGYDLDVAAAQPGGNLFLTLYWQAGSPIEQGYKVFTHLLGDVYNGESGNFLWGQRDNEPAHNTRPTTTWRSGEVIVDSYMIPIHGQAPTGDYRVEVGLYQPTTGERLPLLNGAGTAVADHVILTAVTISDR